MVSISSYKTVFLWGVYVNVDINNVIDKYSKPNDPTIFYLVEDVKKLMEIGFTFGSEIYKSHIGYFVRDAPARAFVLNVKSQSAFYCCTNCTQNREYYQRKITFPAEPRTDESFKNRSQPENHTVTNYP